MARASSSQHTPVMQQYFRAKREYPDALLFFRMGDFYEFFYDDAVEAARLLELTLTSRSKSPADQPIPMAGVPHHAATGYIARLLALGKKVAVCEQMADPKTVKGIVPREVVRVVTPGLVLDPEALDARAHNYLAAVASEGGRFGIVTLELSTAELRACVLDQEAAALAELLRLDPRELLLGGDSAGLRSAFARLRPQTVLSELGEVAPVQLRLSELLGVERAERMQRQHPPLVLAAVADALSYARRNQPAAPWAHSELRVYDPLDQLMLDDAAVRNLELLKTLGGEKRGALLGLLDQTCTPPGARLLRRRLVSPLTALPEIRRRHDVVEALVADAKLRTDLRACLGHMADLERLATRIAAGVATPRDLGSVRDTLFQVGQLAQLLWTTPSELHGGTLRALAPTDLCEDLLADLSTTLVDELPLALGQGPAVRAGVDAGIDELRDLSSSSKDVLLALEERERARTQIPSLKVRYTRVFGYYIEVTRANLSNVPRDYRRKQTVANGERYVTDELEELEAKIASAETRLRALEQACFEGLRARIAAHSARLYQLAAALADLDVHAALAEAAHRYDYVRPTMDDSRSLRLLDLRHPVVERLSAAGTFVPSDVTLSADDARMMMITGPNMAGKSTTMRQVALAVIMAQAGGFVPAREAQIGIVDRVFTRVGASDNLAQGQSTFMVEMQEAANILLGASRRSLVILDEVGRGTSTYDGLAIAWAIAEYLHDVIGCRAMFATHYHELCELAEVREGVTNFNVAAREHEGGMVFLHKLVEGAANRSYGVAVAKLAGVPEGVLARARAVLASLEAGRAPAENAQGETGKPQLEMFVAAPAPSAVEATLREIEVDHMTPVQALMALAQLKALLPPG